MWPNIDPVKISGRRSGQKFGSDRIRIPTLCSRMIFTRVRLREEFIFGPGSDPQLQSKSKCQKQTDKLLCNWYYLFKGIVSRDLLEYGALRLLLKFHFRVEFFDCRASA
jgi:hypothetical protein